jgi:uncharacterized protein
MKRFECRKGCGACCIAPSISSPLPGMPAGKPAGVRCFHLAEDNICVLYNKPERPKVCVSYRASDEICGSSTGEALQILTAMENLTV